MSLVLDTGVMKYRENSSQSWRPLVIKANMNWESLADTYDPDNGTYEVGQYVLEDGAMYRCISEINTPETWTAAHWTEINIGDELFSFRNTLTQLDTDLDAEIATRQTYVRPNLLDNWYFGNPVNQRGQNIYNGSGYTIDRWHIWEGSLSYSFQYNDITFTVSSSENGLFQYLGVDTRKNLLGKTITVSALLSDGTLVQVSGVVPVSTNANISTYFDNRGYLNFCTDLDSTSYSAYVQIHLFANKSVSVKAVKLELGSGQTLAHQENGVWVLNEIPNYDEQLYRCCASTADSSDTYANMPYNKLSKIEVGDAVITSNASGIEFKDDAASSKRVIKVGNIVIVNLALWSSNNSFSWTGNANEWNTIIEIPFEPSAYYPYFVPIQSSPLINFICSSSAGKLQLKLYNFGSVQLTQGYITLNFVYLAK